MKWVIVVCLFLSACVDSSKPSVLIIGDSISLGYTPFVQVVVPNVEHAPKCVSAPYQTGVKRDNSEGSAHQAACIDEWLSVKHYDIVHFNAGIWDSNQCGSNQANNLSDYLNNLQIELDSIRAHGAIPIFATTTPVPMPNDSCADESVIETYNSAAIELMQSQGVQIDDIYSIMKSHADLHKTPTNVHWVEEGYELMGEQVSDSISH